MLPRNLNRLIAHRYELYHDVPFDGYNVDHVLVGPQGVFSVETKTYRKPIRDKTGALYTVDFDGRHLHWPWGRRTGEVSQAARSAKSLSDWLGKAVGEPVAVQAILTIPGWWVERKGWSDAVWVLNPKEIIKSMVSLSLLCVVPHASTAFFTS